MSAATERYPEAAIVRAINALELSYSYLRDKPVVGREIDRAIHYLRRVQELHARAAGDPE